MNIEQGAHIICQCRVTIEDEVSITRYCVIVDVEHPFDDPDRPPKIGSRLNDRVDSFVRIGRGSFIGVHSVILPNVSIGRGCVIGAGSVVTKSIPDYCVVSGAPAHVVRRFDPATRQWAVPRPRYQRTDSNSDGSETPSSMCREGWVRRLSACCCPPSWRNT